MREKWSLRKSILVIGTAYSVAFALIIIGLAVTDHSLSTTDAVSYSLTGLAAASIGFGIGGAVGFYSWHKKNPDARNDYLVRGMKRGGLVGALLLVLAVLLYVLDVFTIWNGPRH